MSQNTLATLLAGMPDRFDHLARRWARDTPEAPAFLTDARRVSWAEFDAAVDRAAALLQRAGVRPGDRVMLVAENGIAPMALVFAASRLDTWASPLNARMSAREIATMQDFAGVRLTAYTVDDSAAAAQRAAQAGAAPHEDPVFGRIALGPLRQDAEPEPVFPDGERQIAVLTFTSGTTGRPKAVMLPHRAVMYTGASQALSRSLTAADRLYVIAPLSHAIGLGGNVLAAAWCGAACVLVPRFDPAHLAAAINAGEVTFIVAVPQVYARLLDHAQASGLDLRRGALRVLGTGGAPLDPALRARVVETFGLPFSSGYGATEITPVTRVPDGVDAGGEAIGEAQPGVEIRLVKEDGTEAAPGEVGEIWVRGPSLMAGYYRDPEATAAVMRPGGWYATGDVGRSDGRGSYSIAGRIKELIIRSGFNVYPVEVEAVLNAHPAVAQSAVVGRPVAGNEEVVAFVQPAAGRRLEEAELRAYLKENLAPYKVPTEIVIAELPIGPTGKILKGALRDSVAGGGTP